MGLTRIHSTSATWDNHSPMGPIQEHWHFLICYKADLNSQLAPIEDAQAPICGEFTAYSEEIGPPAPQPLEFSTTLFIVGQSTGFRMGGMAETTISSWKADQGSTLHLATTKKTHYYISISTLLEMIILVSDNLLRRTSCLQISSTSPRHRIFRYCEAVDQNSWS